MAQRGVSVYQLLDPRTGSVRYVGYSSDPRRRFANHACDAAETHKARWIRALQRDGLTPVLAILCVVETAEEAKRIEVALIARLRAVGANLTNATAGGDGLADPTTEVRAKCATRTGIPHTPETRAKISAGNTGKRMSVETKQKIAAARSGTTATESARAKMAAAKLGKSRAFSPSHLNNLRAALSSATTRQRMRAAKTGTRNNFFGRRHSSAARARWSAMKAGSTHSDATRAKMRASQSKRRRIERLKTIAKTHPQLVRSLTITSRFLIQAAQ